MSVFFAIFRIVVINVWHVPSPLASPVKLSYCLPQSYVMAIFLYI